MSLGSATVKPMNAPHKRGSNKGASGEWHSNAKLTWDIVTEIRKNVDRLTPKQMAERYDVSNTTIRQVLDGTSWKEENRPPRQ